MVSGAYPVARVFPLFVAVAVVAVLTPSAVELVGLITEAKKWHSLSVSLSFVFLSRLNENVLKGPSEGEVGGGTQRNTPFYTNGVVGVMTDPLLCCQLYRARLFFPTLNSVHGCFRRCCGAKLART